MKAILISDYMADHASSPPDHNTIRNYGHDLLALMNTCTTLARDKYRCDNFNAVEPDSISSRIIQHLSDFARKTRYHNIDQLTQTTTAIDPLAAWNSIVREIISVHVHPNRLARIRDQGQTIGTALAPISAVIATDLDQSPMDIIDLATVPRLLQAAAPYSVIYIYEVLQSLNALLSCVVSKVMEHDHQRGAAMPTIPYMHEFFEFLGYERGDAMRKRNGHKKANNALLGTRHKWRVPRTLTFDQRR